MLRYMIYLLSTFMNELPKNFVQYLLGKVFQ